MHDTALASLYCALRLALAASVLQLLIVPVAISAQSPDDSNPVLEEIIVTAQKREQSLQDVAIAVSVISGEKLAEFAISNLEEMSQYVPNFSQVATPTSNVVIIRGIGSGPNAGFEQSVGTFKDGVYLGRARQTLAPLFDLARVEVLKGPQSILFGKNTVAGAVNINSNRPGYEASARIAGLYGSQGERQLQGYVNGPLDERLAGRLALYGSGLDGWVENDYDGSSGPDTTIYAARGSLVFDPTDKVSAYLKYERSSGKTRGGPYEIYKITQTELNGELVPPQLTNLDAGQDYRTNYGNNGAIGSNTSESDRSFDDMVMQWDFQVGEHKLTSITGYTAYNFESNADLDYTPTDFVNASDGLEKYSQWSQELRLLSPIGSRFEYITGLYFQRSHLDIEQNIGVDFSTVIPVASLVGADGFRIASFDQSSDTASVFFQGSFAFTPAWRLKFGLRYTYETKSLDRSITIKDFNGASMSPLALARVWQKNFNSSPYVISLDRYQDDWSPMLALEWNATDDIMTYLSATKGFKDGGYDSTHGNGLDLASLEYGPETAYSLELGSKMSFMGGRGKLNLALFNTRYQDLQVSVFNGFSGFKVQNAAEATSQGLELDTRWLLTPALLVSGSIAWLDYKYDKYDTGPCSNAQLAQQIVDTGSSDGCTNDLAGEPAAGAPDWRLALSGTYTAQMSQSLDMVFTLDANYVDDVFLGPSLDFNLLQQAYWKLNGRIALTPASGRWVVAIVGKNLTDTVSYTSAFAVPSGSSNAPAWNIPDFDGSYAGVVARPRSLALQLGYNFF